MSSERTENLSGSRGNISPGAGEKHPVEERDDTYVARVARGAGISTAGQGVGRVLGYVTQIFISRLFGLSAYGFYVAGVALVNGAQILSRFGMENGVVRYVAHYREENDTARIRGTIIQALGITLAISLVLSAVMFFGASLAEGWEFRGRSMETILQAFAFVLPFFVFMSMVVWATQGFQTVTYAAYVQQIIRPALFLGLVGVVYLLGAEIIGVIAAYAVSMFLGGLAGLYYLRKLFPPLFDRKVPAKFETKALFSVSVPMSVATGAQYLNTWSAVLILSFFAIGSPVGIFNAAARTATFLTVVRFAFSGIFSPIISGLYAREDMEDLSRLYKDVCRWIFTGAFIIFLVIVTLAPDVMAVFGRQAVSGVEALIIVSFAQLFSSSVGPAPRMLAMTGNQNIAMVVTASAAAIGVAVSLILIPQFTVLGAAIGMATAIVCENTGTMVAVKRRLGFWPFSPQWLKPLAAGLVSAAVTYLLSLAVSLPGAILDVVVLGTFLGLLFLALLWLLGLSDTDKEFIGEFQNVAKRVASRGEKNAG